MRFLSLSLILLLKSDGFADIPQMARIGEELIHGVKARSLE